MPSGNDTFQCIARVYNKKLCLQQILCKAIGGAKPERRVCCQTACSGVAELGATVVARGNDADDLSALGLLKQVLEVLHDVAIWLPSLQGDYLCLWRRAWVLQFGFLFLEQ